MKTFAFEGRLPLLWLTIAGLLLAGVFVLLAVKERRYATRPRWIWFLLALRILVLSLVLWALAGPTDVTEEKRTKPKGFGVFADGSASMTIQDIGDGSGNVARWEDTGVASAEALPRILLDKALGALSGARASLRQFATISTDGDGSVVEEVGSRVLGKARGALESCEQHLDGISPSSSDFEERESAKFAELLLLLNEKIIPAVSRVNVSLAGTGGDSIAVIDGLFNQADQTLRMLADTVYSRHEQKMTAALVSGANSEFESSDRISSVTPWLEALENQWLAPQKETLRVGRFAFDSAAVPTGAGAWRKDLVENPADPELGTNLSSAIEQAAREASAGRLHAGVLVTDGAHNTGRDPREAAVALQGVPFAIVPIGDARLRRDLFLHHVQYAKSLIHKDVLSIDAKVTAHDCEGEKVTVELLSGETVVDRKSVTIRTVMEDHRVSLKWKASTLGMREFQLRVVPVDGEFTEENNSERLKVQVIDDEIRVFLADDLPRWEFRYLLNLFKRDPKVKSESALFSPQHVYPNRRDRPALPRLPDTMEEWRRFRVVILGDLKQEQFSTQQQKQVKQYLIEGGNLVVIAGENAMPQGYAGTEFGDLMPVDFGSLSQRAITEGFTLAVTSDGRDVPPVQLASTSSASAELWHTISKSVPVYDLSPCSVPKPTANVLIEAKSAIRSRGERRAFLSWQYVGRGRVVYAAAPALHKLRYRHGDRYHYRFWGQMLRWIVARDLTGGSKSVQLATDKTRYPAGERVQATLRLTELDGQPVSRQEVTLSAHLDGRTVGRIAMKPDKTVPGEYHAVLVGLPPGPVKLTPQGSAIDTLLRREKYDDPIAAEIAIDPHESIELRNPLCDLSLLGALADATGGVVLSPVAAREFLNHLDLAPNFEQRSEREALWSGWWLLLTICTLLLLEWICRKAIGLV